MRSLVLRPALRRSLSAAFCLGCLLGPAASRAFAINIRDLIALSKEGVTDDVLVAIIEADGSRFSLSAKDVRDLRTAGLSDTVHAA
jgi:hypothetical protein